jgi:hypothetical protein
MKNLLDFLRDPIWQFILGAAGIIISGIISIFIYRRQQPRKEITCRLVSVTPLFNIKENFQGKLQVLFDSKPIENVYIITIRVYNSGNTSVTSSDYEQPINVVIGTDEILSSEVLETTPHGIPASVKFSANEIQISPTLLNPNDALVINAVVNQYYERVNVSARIVGIRKLELLLPEQFEKDAARAIETASELISVVAAITAMIGFLISFLSLVGLFR